MATNMQPHPPPLPPSTHFRVATRGVPTDRPITCTEPHFYTLICNPRYQFPDEHEPPKAALSSDSAPSLTDKNYHTVFTPCMRRFNLEYLAIHHLDRTIPASKYLYVKRISTVQKPQQQQQQQQLPINLNKAILDKKAPFTISFHTEKGNLNRFETAVYTPCAPPPPRLPGCQWDWAPLWTACGTLLSAPQYVGTKDAAPRDGKRQPERPETQNTTHQKQSRVEQGQPAPPEAKKARNRMTTRQQPPQSDTTDAARPGSAAGPAPVRSHRSNSYQSIVDDRTRNVGNDAFMLVKLNNPDASAIGRERQEEDNFYVWAENIVPPEGNSNVSAVSGSVTDSFTRKYRGGDLTFYRISDVRNRFPTLFERLDSARLDWVSDPENPLVAILSDRIAPHLRKRLIANLFDPKYKSPKWEPFGY